MRELSKQELFWAGEFGNQYIQRNQGEAVLASKLALMTQVLQRTQEVGSVIEFGANIGLNLVAVHALLPGAELSAIEINATAAEECGKLPGVTVYNTSIYDFQVQKQYDLVIACGVLIHQNPQLLSMAYDKLCQSCGRYLLVSEYYSPNPTEVTYRGHEGVLFKRDFAGEIMDAHSEFQLVDYGFRYHRDVHFPGDDGNWFLLEKKR